MSYGRQVHDAVAVAEALAPPGIEVEVLDLRSLAPLDEDTLVESVGRTGRAVIVHEAVVTGGFGAELAAWLSEALFGAWRRRCCGWGRCPRRFPMRRASSAWHSPAPSASRPPSAAMALAR